MDRKTDMMKPTVDFHNFGNVPKNRDTELHFKFDVSKKGVK